MGKQGSIAGLPIPPPVTAQEHRDVVRCNGFDFFVCPQKHLHIFTTADGRRVTEHAIDAEDGYALARAIESACDEIIGA